MGELAHRIKNKIRTPAWLFKSLNRRKPQFECPVCHYHGPFRDFDSFAGLRLHVECPRCGTLTVPEKAGSILSLQGVKMGRPSYVHISIDIDRGEISSVRVGGESVLAGEGTLYV